MASKNQIIGGAFQDVLGDPLANGYMEMQLSQDAVTADGKQVTGGRVITVPLDEDGNVVVDPQELVWPNDVLLPAGTYYTVCVFSSTGQLVWGPNYQQVLSEPSPFDIGTWIPNSVNVVGPSRASLLLQTNGVDNASQVLLNLVAGDGIILTNVGGMVTISQGPTFSIVSFTGDKSGAYEVGQVVSSPSTFTASYSSTPTSASISDGTHSISLVSPFTTGVLPYTYTSPTPGSVVFTLTAVGPTTKVATTSMTFSARTFGGVGTAGATAAVTASGTTAVLSNGYVLASAGLGNQSNYGAYNPVGQKIYILTTGASHTFKDANTGFAVPFNSPTAVSFTNQYGQVVSMYLYETANTLTGTFTIQVAG